MYWYAMRGPRLNRMASSIVSSPDLLGRLIRQLREPAGPVNARAQRLRLYLEGRAAELAPLGHGLHVAAGAETAARPGEHHDADGRILRESGQRLEQRVQHRARHGVQPIGPVQREHRNSVLDGFQHVLGHGDPPGMTVPRWYHRPGEGGRAHGGGQGLESSVRGRAARASRRAPGLQDLGAPDRSPSAGAVALSQQRAGHLLRPPGPAAPLPARPQGRTSAGARRDLHGPRPAAASRHERGRGLRGVPGAAGPRRVRLRSADLIAMRGWTILIVTLLVGAGLGAAGTIYLPSMVDPYLPQELRIRARVVEGQVLNKQREPNRLLVKIQLEQGVILATYTKRVAEVDLLVEPGDTIALELRSGEPVVDEPPIERVKRKK